MNAGRGKVFLFVVAVALAVILWNSSHLRTEINADDENGADATPLSTAPPPRHPPWTTADFAGLMCTPDGVCLENATAASPRTAYSARSREQARRGASRSASLHRD